MSEGERRPPMLKLLLLAIALSPLFAAERNEVNITTPSKVGNVTLEPGVYQVKLQGAIVIFTDTARKSVSTFAKIEKLTKPAAGTALMGETSDGAYRISSILIAGLDCRIV